MWLSSYTCPEQSLSYDEEPNLAPCDPAKAAYGVSRRSIHKKQQIRFVAEC